jgi:hypothetical protein
MRKVVVSRIVPYDPLDLPAHACSLLVDLTISKFQIKPADETLKSGGTIAIAEWLVNDDRTKPLPSLMFAVQMLVNTEKGDTFSFNEIKAWLEEAGFKKVRKLQAPGPSPLILATKS